MDETVYVGNAGLDGATNAGWLLGHFAPPGRSGTAPTSR